MTNQTDPAWKRRSVLLWSAVVGLATFCWFAVAVVLAAEPAAGSTPDVLALVGVVLVLGAHLWCSRQRILASVASVVVPGLLLFVAPSFASDGQTSAANGIVAACAVLVALTTALVTWWGNRRGPSGPIGGLWRLG